MSVIHREIYHHCLYFMNFITICTHKKGVRIKSSDLDLPTYQGVDYSYMSAKSINHKYLSDENNMVYTNQFQD